MRRVLILGALVALMAVRGAAEDPKPEEKKPEMKEETKDPFRKWELGRVKFKSNDERLKIEDLRFIQVPSGADVLTTFKFNAKNRTQKTLSQAYLFIALFDDEKRLIDVSIAAIGKSENMFDRNDKLAGDEVFAATSAFIGRHDDKAKFWQATVVVGKEE
jgi:hypothetical protein